MNTNREPFSDLYSYSDSLEIYYPPGILKRMPKRIKYLAIPFIVGFTIVFLLTGIHVFIQLFIIDNLTYSPGPIEPIPTPYSTPYPLPSVIYINDHDLRRLPNPINWSCPVGRSCSKVEQIELNWRTLSVVNNQAVRTKPRENKYPVWHIEASTWAAWYDSDTVYEAYIKNTSLDHGDAILICAMGGFSRGDRSLPDVHRVGETRASEYKWCQHGTITKNAPNPPIRGEVEASVSQYFREYACIATNQTVLCELNDLTEIVVLVIAERYRE